ncbi:hypothetical protein SCHPADRAFT_516001 [Schizopora paradoxa]|uniref:Uncharacterized protein n=1 Tax=Schizopora paradoxa TaxID=27342 RepID=A0A0H2RG43_9AGAM|nr:hypothetical protein SCHPADRAFT_516001 [Schizopora paradoxa]
MGSNLPSRSPYRHPTYDDTPGDEDADVVMPLSSLFLDELREDDTTTVYSYYSTWSTNYTMSNLVGPGRLLGNFYSRAGRSLEKRLRRVVNRAAIKEYKDAVGVLQSANFYATFDSDDPNEHEKACKALLTCARPRLLRRSYGLLSIGHQNSNLHSEACLSNIRKSVTSPPCSRGSA